ncbi:3'(2'),5'-bisphosphate nucleotidase [Rhodococcus sp. OK611]|jgi:3'(2'), 5'-bisphosphate nucleotidase|uniref:3'(2'),5'-bisphosphate nucleotidase CysQ n=1 Tax=unclassified Rhodococcus (in: high G+C Gram-positive bacteria) TaxID=192944 RepID=UPI000BDCA38C|nr:MULTISPECIES: 3'(2'),5'-bisphosphate nucleotidase CysQ [unclassified Rhodococcus (in: high G+C Gram-positive bacteria)]PTR37455.1 3'(2'),5'-bisphosphate nucleotidase [Rhodococcus sp. OK611]SNX93361.1 3'(2'),5'-bisphosphate nucleotidase [Rhodococcus sp. OK270]
MTTDAALAGELATRAGQLLLELRNRELGETPLEKTQARELGRRGDKEANTLLLGLLGERRPHDAVLSEESADDRARLDNPRVWIIDPLDGSREYGLPGRPDWAVHVALWERGAGITAAAVAQPALGEVYVSGSAQSVDPAGRARPRLESTTRPRPRIVVSDSRPPEFIGALAERIGADVAPMGSAGAKAMAVLRGEADAYVHAGGQWEWDSAAPVGVALAAGLHCSRIDGTPLVYNEAHPYLPDLVICRPELARPLLDGIAALTGAPADSPRVAMAREYLSSLVTHDASKVRLAADCFRVENGQRTGDSGPEIIAELEHGDQYKPITGIRDLEFREWGPNVVARFLLDMGAGEHVITVAITEHFSVPGGEIESILAIIEPHPAAG